MSTALCFLTLALIAVADHDSLLFKVILAEFIVQRDSRPLTTAFNLHMVVMFGSQERTPQEYEALFNKSKGWKFDKVTPTRTDFNLVLGEAV